MFARVGYLTIGVLLGIPGVAAGLEMGVSAADRHEAIQAESSGWLLVLFALGLLAAFVTTWHAKRR